jgi:GAF domain-containing protein
MRAREVPAEDRDGTRVLAGMYRLTDRLHGAETPKEAYEAALDAVTRVPGCSRASILLLEEAGTIRVAAWRDLSEAYRRAVEGRWPSMRHVRDPQPVCIQDIEAADLPESLKCALRAERIGALAFIPLVANDAVIGKLVTYYDACHELSVAELALAVSIAQQLGASLERRHAEQALREAQMQLTSELAAAHELQKISTQLIPERDAGALYDKILDAAVGIMRSDFASMQMFYPDRGELRLLAYRGFNPAAAAFWE